MKIISAIILVFNFSSAFGQSTNLYPETFAGFFNHQALLNPAFQKDTGKMAFTASIKARTGAFKGIATYYAALERNFMNEKNSGHTVRIIFYDEKEGPYIGKPRGYLNYAYRLVVANQTFVGAGAALGFTQVAFSAPSVSAAGTATMPDGSIGLYMKHKRKKIGVSWMQLFNNQSSPANVAVKLHRYYNFYGEIEKELNYAWNVKTALLFRLLPEYRDNLDLALLFSYKKTFLFGTSARYRYGMSFFVSFNVPAGNDLLSFNFVYNTPFFSNITNLNNSFEISPSYALK